MPHKYNPKHAHHLDSLLRRLMFPPEKILYSIGLKPDDIFLDIGAGTGFFSIPASKMLTKGKVIAIDIEPEMIQILSNKINKLKITNIETIISKDGDLKVQSNSVTVAFMSFVLHEIEDKLTMLTAIHNALQPKGKIAILEFSSKTTFGPPKHERISETEITELLIETGFSNITVEKINFASYLAKAIKL